MVDFNSLHKRPTHSGSKDRTPGGFRIRSPVFELFALHHKRSLGIGKARLLLSSEIDVARSIFGKAIDYRHVRILKASAISSPTVIGSYIRSNGKRPFLGCPPVFIHELTHVWQYQSKGLGYISNSLLQQLKYAVSGGDVRVQIIPGSSIYSYSVEEQAEIVSDYYIYKTFKKIVEELEPKGKLLRAKNGKIALLPLMERTELKLSDEQEFIQSIDRVENNKKEYDRLIAQVRQSRPLPKDILKNIIEKEALWDEGIPKAPTGQRDCQPNPWIRIEF